MAYNIFIFILFYSIAVVPCIGMYNKALYSKCHARTNARSSSMAQTVLTWTNSQGKVWSMQFHVYLHVFESEFASGVKDVTFVLIYIRFMC